MGYQIRESPDRLNTKGSHMFNTTCNSCDHLFVEYEHEDDNVVMCPNCNASYEIEEDDE